MSNEIYEFEISRNAEGAILATAGVKGEGTSYRIAGPKAWGGSKRLAAIDISQRDMVEFIRCYAPAALAELCATVASAAPTDERAAFEKAMNAARFFPAELDFTLTKSPSGKRDEYVNTHLESCWNGWQARAAIAAQQAAPKAELAEIARLIGTIFYAGNFVAETQNERELEALLIKTGHRYRSWSEVEAAAALASLPVPPKEADRG